MPEKYIVVTGGVLSGIGKGIFSASLSRVLKEVGVDINVLKIDPYLNVDAGTMNPNQHGEVFVTDDGYEADLDLGHYERFLGVSMTRKNNITAGQVYSTIIQREREGKYLGSTVQVVPHVTSEIKERITTMPGKVLSIEIGGTVGDIEGEVFLEAVRELAFEKNRNDFLFVHVTYVPYLRVTNEFKTKPTQQSVQLLRKIGIQPDIIVVRSELPIDSQSLYKIALFSGVPREMVINLPDIGNVYQIPETLYEAGVHKLVAKKLGIEINEGPLNWVYPKSFKPYRIALIGKYLGTDDAYKSIIESIFLSGVQKPVVVDAQELEELDDNGVAQKLSTFDALIIPGGFGRRGIEGKIKAIKYARENKKPILGICLGMQLMAIEFARNVMGLKGANSTEFDESTPYPVVNMMEEQKKIMNLGGTMRLGAQKMRVLKGTKLYNIYNQEEVFERHRHRYEVDTERFSEMFKRPGEEGYKFVISGESEFLEAIEIEGHPFFIGVQYHPEYKSKVGQPHQIFLELIRAIEEVNS
ncbi:CTP synthase [Fervidobacterium sp. 2310opik-2]|uniref:CTP synthase n=1 Tax=Fervidobacterium sp. 2310opik-2 TaxID=1755815 RepID=UPI0013E0BBCC|nr:CTP synthase [Fervidobacterium sp. 2310opik-2]KAF2961220.1 CTP synthetase [Fervidobacterium sp. 2310opik-2]